MARKHFFLPSGIFSALSSNSRRLPKKIKTKSLINQPAFFKLKPIFFRCVFAESFEPRLTSFGRLSVSRLGSKLASEIGTDADADETDEDRDVSDEKRQKQKIKKKRFFLLHGGSWNRNRDRKHRSPLPFSRWERGQMTSRLSSERAKEGESREWVRQWVRERGRDREWVRERGRDREWVREQQHWTERLKSSALRIPRWRVIPKASEHEIDS